MTNPGNAPLVDLSGLNAGQRKIAETLDAPLFVEAGAGSGKTFTLTQRVAWALCPGSGEGGKPFLDDLGQVLVITFTEAAAREIRERVRSTLRRVGLQEASLAVDDAWISTIHGMCSKILRRHALDLGLDPEFRVVSGSEQNSMYLQAMDAVMRAAAGDAGLAAAIGAAGVGSWSAESGFSGAMGIVDGIIAAARAVPGGLAALDVAYPAAGADVDHLMRELLMRCEELGAEKLTAAAAAKVGPSLEALRAFDALAPGAKTPDAAAEALKAVSLPRSSKAIADKLADAKSALAAAQAEVLFLSGAGHAGAYLELARRVDAEYTRVKREASACDNDDLVALAYAAVRDVEAVRADYAGRFRLVMVDEFQDTDDTQLALIGLLAGEGARHLCTVGDAQQSIYRFRGADVGVFYRRGTDVAAEGKVRLDTNYRSHGDILKFVERVSRGNAGPGLGSGGGCSGTMEAGAFMHLDDCPTRKDAYRARNLPRVDVEVVCGKGASGYATKQQVATMASQIADALARYRDAGERPGDMALLLGVTSNAGLYIDALRSRGLECVVTGGSTFTKAPEVKVMCALLHTLANPADTQSGLFPLLASEMFALDADDFCELGTRLQEKLPEPTKRPIDQGLAAFEFLPGHVPSARLSRAREVIARALADVAREPVADVCCRVVRDSGWLARLEAGGTQGQAKAANVLASIRYIRDLTQSLGLGPARAATEFDLWLAASKIAPASLAGGESGAGTVRIMTIHASKGLEFPVTAVAECWNDPRDSRALAVAPGSPAALVVKPAGLDDADAKALTSALKGIDADDALDDLESGRALPLSSLFVALGEKDAREAAQEKARLLYVAMTRAREALILGVSAAEGSAGVSSTMAANALFALFGSAAAPACGLSSVDYGGEAPARVRCVRVQIEGKGEERACLADSAGSLEGFDGPIPLDPSAIVGAADSDGKGEPAGGEFELFEVEPDADAAFGSWRAREGVYSYSSVHAAMALDAGEPACAPTRAEREAADEGAPSGGDVDRATNLGSAFHELAQAMAESGREPSEEQLAAMARRWNLSARARARLAAAIGRWTRSSIRAEALSHAQVRPEAPFFVARPCEHGDYLEGAIDLLCTDEGSREALVVDYKTGDAGLSADEVRARHAMQAEFYAGVLLGQGWERVECAFVCVERDDPQDPGEPLVARYAFPR